VQEDEGGPWYQGLTDWDIAVAVANEACYLYLKIIVRAIVCQGGTGQQASPPSTKFFCHESTISSGFIGLAMPIWPMSREPLGKFEYHYVRM